MALGLGLATAIGLMMGLRADPLDLRPPDIHLAAPADSVSGITQVRVHITDRTPGLAQVQVTLDGDRLAGPEALQALNTTALADGAHTIVVRAWDRAGNHRSRSTMLWVDNTAPSVELAPWSSAAAQGRILGVLVHTDETLVRAEAQMMGETARLYPLGDDGYRALFGVTVSQPPGPTPLHIELEDAAGNIGMLTVDVTIHATEFPRGGFIRLNSTQTAARRDKAGRQRTFDVRTAVYDHEQAEQFWQGAMVRPVVGRLTSAFGRFRTYSDGRKRHHLGTDIANVTGTPVVAAAAGEVREAGLQAIFGNVVMVHHGQGVVTSYNHLSQIAVEIGDQVAAGQLLGRVGSTGQSTGPHLHWGLQVRWAEVDAERWPDHGFDPTVWMASEPSVARGAP
jgi:murein DD-endopeptidase MepM/ murein hydrolase activator NlpD